MDQKIFPSEILEQTADYHFQRYNQRSIALYRIILLIVLISLVAIFFIKVDVSVNSPGIIKSDVERAVIKPLISGVVDSIYVQENDLVTKGDVILTIKSDEMQEESSFISDQINVLQSEISDLSKLVAVAKSKDWKRKMSLNTSLFAQEYLNYGNQVQRAYDQYELVQIDYKRSESLFEAGAISSKEFESIKFDYERVRNEVFRLMEQQAMLWQSGLRERELTLKGLKSNAGRNAARSDLFQIKAPVSGSIQNIRSLQPGSSVAMNQTLGEVSPDGGLIAEIPVMSKDIGFIKEGNLVRFQVDAFNYNEWGLLEGEVQEIPRDISINEQGVPYFLIRCILHSNHLSLQNGVQGNLKKGMTVNARFVLAKRTIFQLIYDNADDWLNPNQTPTTNENPG